MVRICQKEEDMFELVQAGERTYYIQAPAKIGIYEAGGHDVYLIDSGNDKDAGRKVRKVLEQNSWNLKAILNTHSNADHIGGNRYLQQQYGCRIYAPGMEAAFTKHPLLEPSFLYGGYPFKELRHKFLMAAPSCAEDVTAPGFPQEIDIIPLPGHFFDMAGYRTPDGTVFLADCLSSQPALEKYGLTFLYDVAAYLDTLHRVSSMQAELFIPSHADAARDIRPLARLNEEKVLEIAQQIKHICEVPHPFESLLQKLFTQYQLNMNFEQYVLIGSTVRSYLAWLKDRGEICGSFKDNQLLWNTVL